MIREFQCCHICDWHLKRLRRWFQVCFTFRERAANVPNLFCHGRALSQKGTGSMGIAFEEELTDGWAVLWLMLWMHANFQLLSRELSYPTLGKGKIIFPATFEGDMLVPWRVVTSRSLCFDRVSLSKPSCHGNDTWRGDWTGSPPSLTCGCVHKKERPKRNFSDSEIVRGARNLMNLYL